MSGHVCLLEDFCGVRVTWYLLLCVCFVDRCLSFCTFSFDHCVVCSSIYRFWLPLWYLQTLLASVSTVVLIHITTVLTWWYFLCFCFSFRYQLLGWFVILRCHARFPIHICRDNNNGPMNIEITSVTIRNKHFLWEFSLVLTGKDKVETCLFWFQFQSLLNLAFLNINILT